MRILMIEDDEKLCEVVCYHLEREGFTVDVCHDGDDGLRWVRQQAHDLVILDRMLPTLSGTTVLAVSYTHLTSLMVERFSASAGQSIR